MGFLPFFGEPDHLCCFIKKSRLLNGSFIFKFKFQTHSHSVLSSLCFLSFFRSFFLPFLSVSFFYSPFLSLSQWTQGRVSNSKKRRKNKNGGLFFSTSWMQKKTFLYQLHKRAGQFSSVSMSVITAHIHIKCVNILKMWEIMRKDNSNYFTYSLFQFL